MLTWLAHLVAPLNHVVFVMGNDHVSWGEILGFVTGAACVWLTVKARISNFPIGIANSAFFLVLFATARLWRIRVSRLFISCWVSSGGGNGSMVELREQSSS